MDVFLHWYAQYPHLVDLGMRTALFSALVYLVFYKKKTPRFFVWVGTVFLWSVTYAASLTAVQYYVWSTHTFTKSLLTLPVGADTVWSWFYMPIYPLAHTSLGYFIFYSYAHFWVNVIGTVIAAVLVYGFLKLVQYIRKESLTRIEIISATTLTFLVGGWHVGLWGVLFSIGAIMYGVYVHIFKKHEIRILTVLFVSAFLVMYI